MTTFKRTQTEFAGGDLAMHINDPMGRVIFVPAQRVDIVRPHGDEEQDLWRVRLADGNEFVTDGCELHPHPLDRETNVEFLTRLMEWSRNGAMMQVFVIEAVAKYAQLVQAMTPDEQEAMNNTFLPYAPWKNCADEALTLIEERKI